MNRRLIHIMSSVPEITVKGCWSLDQVSMRISMGDWSSQLESYTAITRKVVGKSARDNPERYCDCFWVHCSSKKFERMCGSRKYPYLPHGWLMEIPRGWGG